MHSFEVSLLLSIAEVTTADEQILTNSNKGIKLKRYSH